MLRTNIKGHKIASLNDKGMFIPPLPLDDSDGGYESSDKNMEYDKSKISIHPEDVITSTINRDSHVTEHHHHPRTNKVHVQSSNEFKQTNFISVTDCDLPNEEMLFEEDKVQNLDPKIEMK